VRVAFKNLFAAQEIVVRLRQFAFRRPALAPDEPYGNSELLATHLADLTRLGERATDAGLQWAIVPFDVGVVTGPPISDRYSRFVAALSQRGLPVIRVDETFADHPMRDLMVNRFDAHPSAHANRLAAATVARELLSRLD
jgi:hypothetical protein